MKRIIVLLLTWICAFTFASCANKSTQEYDEYCYKINKLIKDIDFDKGNIDDGKIVLYSGETEVYNYEYEDYNAKYKIIYIRKEDNKIFFVLNASVDDDDDGIVFVNDDTNRLMDGLGSLERIGGNSYKYKTYK